MAGDLETVKTIATVAAPFTAAIVETWIKPKFVALSKYLKTDKALFEHSLANKFDEYLRRSFDRNLHINVIVFQNQQKQLDEIYIPLTVRNTQNNLEILMDSYKPEFIPTFNKVLIKDTAGMGKSTILKSLFLSCVTQNEGIPIFIELRKLKSDESILSYICNELNPIDDEFDKDFILKLIKQGDFIFFLDGYDEIPFGLRDEVTRNLQDFISKAENNLYVMTSRPESSLASFSDFQEFNIRPLVPEEAYELLRKYDKDGKLSEEIISKLEGGNFDNIKEFLENPLLTSLLYKSYEYKQLIPFKKHIFYRQVYDALFESHDLTKGGSFIREKHSKLDIEDFHRLLRALGFITVKLGQIEYDKDMLLSLLSKAKEQCSDLSVKESDFLKDLLTTVPIFNRDGNYYRWSHKSIQEYFAAQFIWLDAKGHQEKVLRHMLRSGNNENYRNVLDLYYDVDYKTFRQAIIYEYICDFLQHYDSSYSLIDREQVSENDVHNRKLVTFGKKAFLIRPEVLQKLKANENYEVATSTIETMLAEFESMLHGYRPFNLVGEEVAVYINHNDLINQIVRSKNQDIFTDDDELEYRQIFDDLEKWAEYKSRKGSIEKYISNNMDRDCMLVDDNPNLFFNQAAFFAEMNIILIGDSPAFERFLDPKKCRGLKLEIEKEKSREASDDFLFKDL